MWPGRGSPTSAECGAVPHTVGQGLQGGRGAGREQGLAASSDERDQGRVFTRVTRGERDALRQPVLCWEFPRVRQRLERGQGWVTENEGAKQGAGAVLSHPAHMYPFSLTPVLRMLEEP